MYNVKKYIPLIDNTFNFDADDIINKFKKNPFCCGCNCLSFLNDIRKIIPKNFDSSSKEKKIRHVNENTFRISITSFVDTYNFDMKSMKKECVHIITPDLKKIPFSAYNMFHRK
jgi:7,8-dihydro-6-hydroxymethylpterin dimethyltransferase